MSFYGNVFYGVADAFASLFIKNNGRYQDRFISPNTEPVEIPAVGLGGYFNIDSGNKWINLAGDLNSHSCYIYHAAPREEDGFNSAGSFVLTDNVPEDVHNLQPGETFASANIYYDNAGHITGVYPTVFKLPISDTQKDLQELQDRMTSCEETNTAQEESIGTINLNLGSLSSDLSSASSSLSTLSGFVGKKSDFVSETRALTNIIGSTYNLKQLFKDNGITISEAIINNNNLTKGIEGELSTQINDQSKALGNLDTVTKTAFANLCTLLKEHNIDINYDDLIKSS